MGGFYFSLRVLSLGLILCPGYFIAKAQDCPPNIDFETGTFAGWTCYIGSVEAVNGTNEINLTEVGGPVSNRQTMYTANTGEGVDPYGGFPVNCPNGSQHSIRLGNNSAGTEAEGISYEFTIPAGRNVYSMIYHYAVVFQDPNHEQFQQPRLEIEITNLTDNKTIYCSSFTFIPYGSLLPGFFEANDPQGNTPVWCKDWSAVSINLDGNAGKRVRLFFKTADCTFRKHFGYAYIDVNSECSSEFVGSTYCNDDTAINLTAPFGYQKYTWFDPGFTNILGAQQTISFQPPPPAGSMYAVEVVPFNGYGCVDTLYARLEDSLTIHAIAGVDKLSCNQAPVLLGANSIPGEIYSWRPVTGLSDPEISNPLARPPVTTNYILTTSHDGGGCVTSDTVMVKASVVDSSLRLTGSALYCTDTGDSAVLHVQPAKNITWYSDNGLIAGATFVNYRVPGTGAYHALIVNNDGCSISTRIQNIVIDHPTPGIRYPLQYAVVDLPLHLKARNFGETVSWNPGVSLDYPGTLNPVFRGSSDQFYTIDIITKGRCLTVDSQEVKITPNVEIYVPTAFTPNQDGLNDILHPILFGITTLHYFRIYNRQGLQLYQTSTLDGGWDGTFKGVPLMSQVIVWEAEGIGADNKTYVRKGSTLLVR